ncbi:tRNA synthetase class I [Xylariales sp. AK1849]|nr:tRNA synthetase class I [Xylariales sp. AK1849]
MASRPLSPGSLSARSTICRRCLEQKFAASSQKRQVTRNALLRLHNGQEAWDRKADQIKRGETYNLWDMFKERGYVKDIAGKDEQISELMRRKRIGAYVGVDPTAPSLHVGHLLPMMALFWMYMHGYRAVTVVGGATARIGDPTDRLQSREKLPGTDLTMNITKVHYQLKTLWQNVDTQARRFGFQKEWNWQRALLNNGQWYNATSFIEVVSRLFKGMRMGPLLSRDNVKRRTEDGGEGMPLDEFIYPLVQAWDWWHMFSSPREILMQIGGSDQYGNIVTGIEAVKYMRDTEPNLEKRKPDDLLHTPVGFTVPLLTDSSGAKFGKSAGNAVWLDPFMTSSFDLYGYFMRRPDADIENLLKLLTFLPMETINKTMEEHTADPSKRVAQHALAYEVVALAHGAKPAEETRMQHRAVYSKGSSDTVATPPGDTTDQAEVKAFPAAGIPATSAMATFFRVDIELPDSLINSKSIARILYASGLASSVSEGNRLTKLQGAYVAGAPGQGANVNKGMSLGDLTFTPVKNWFPSDTKNFLIDGKLLILRRGKHFIRVVKVVNDEEWAASGRTYPGQPNTGQTRLLKDAVNALKEAGDVNFRGTDLEKLQYEMAKTAAREQGDFLVPGGNIPIPPRPRAPRARRLVEAGRNWDPANPHDKKRRSGNNGSASF